MFQTSQPGEWLQIRSIDLDFDDKGYTLTLSISNNQLTCCSAGDGSIKVYSLSGELLQTYGTRGRGDAGQLDCPFISDDDDDGSVLIADRDIDRLQVMSEQGEFNVLQLQPPVSRPSVSQPRSAVLFNNQLFVTSRELFRPSNIYQYSCWTFRILQFIIKYQVTYCQRIYIHISCRASHWRCYVTRSLGRWTVNWHTPAQCSHNYMESGGQQYTWPNSNQVHWCCMVTICSVVKCEIHQRRQCGYWLEFTNTNLRGTFWYARCLQPQIQALDKWKDKIIMFLRNNISY